MPEPKFFDSKIVDTSFGEGVKIVQPVNIYGAAIGDSCFIGPFVEIQKSVKIGNRTKVQSHTFICELVTIGDDCFIGHGVMFINDVFATGGPAMGDKTQWKETTIGNKVSIGSNATILPVTICDNVVIGAGAVVTKNITIPGVYAGNPAKNSEIYKAMNVPFVDLKTQYNSVKGDIDNAIQSVISQTAFIGGKYVKEFEKAFAELYGVKHVISCANGTDSLYIIMKMLGIGVGDEVITVANSWISSSESITQTGARPVFVDIDEAHYSINEKLIEAAITPHTKAMIIVHLQGQVCDMDAIQEMSKKHNIYLIEDCAQSHFSEYKGKRVGTMGIAGSFSFYPGKNLGAYGDAGCMMTNDDDLAAKCRMYANHGSLTKHQHQVEGINSRLDGLQAAILSAKLPHILKWTEQRIANAALYNKHLLDISQIVLPVVRPDSKHTYHLYVIRAEKRDALAAHLKENGIETAIHYPTALPNLPAYTYLNTKEGVFPVATKYQSEILSLPMYPELTEESISYIADTIKAFYKN